MMSVGMAISKRSMMKMQQYKCNIYN